MFYYSDYVFDNQKEADAKLAALNESFFKVMMVKAGAGTPAHAASNSAVKGYNSYRYNSLANQLSDRKNARVKAAAAAVSSGGGGSDVDPIKALQQWRAEQRAAAAAQRAAAAAAAAVGGPGGGGEAIEGPPAKKPKTEAPESAAAAIGEAGTPGGTGGSRKTRARACMNRKRGKSGKREKSGKRVTRRSRSRRV